MAFDAFIHIDTIEGESYDAEYTGEMEVLDYHMGVSQSTQGSFSSSGSHTTERADWTPFTFTKSVDAASPMLTQYCADGTHVDTVVFSISRAGTEKQKFLEYTFQNCIIQSVTTGGSAGGDFPTENITIMFGKYKQVYAPTSSLDGQVKGSKVATYDIVAGKK